MVFRSKQKRRIPMKQTLEKISRTAKIVKSRKKAVPQRRMTDREEAEKIAALM